jgi:hypothetical protein
MRVHRIGNPGKSSIRRAWYRSVQTRTLACGESAAPGNSTAFVWVVWKGAPPARTKRPVTAFIVQVTDRLALMRIEVDCHPALAYACDMNRPGNSSSHRLFIGEASLSRNLI